MRILCEIFTTAGPRGQTLGLVGQTELRKGGPCQVALCGSTIFKEPSEMAMTSETIAYRTCVAVGYVPPETVSLCGPFWTMFVFGNPLTSPLKGGRTTKLAQVYEDIKAMPEGFKNNHWWKGVSAYQAVKKTTSGLESCHDFGPRYFWFWRLLICGWCQDRTAILLTILNIPARTDDVHYRPSS